MANNPKANVRCPYCSAKFSFGLPSKFMNNPTKLIHFQCTYCTERFDIKPLDLFEDDTAEISQQRIRVRTPEGMQLYQDWDDVRDDVTSGKIARADQVSAFGQSWLESGDTEELQESFPKLPDPEDLVFDDSEDEERSADEPPEAEASEAFDNEEFEEPEENTLTDDEPVLANVFDDDSEEAVAEDESLEDLFNDDFSEEEAVDEQVSVDSHVDTQEPEADISEENAEKEPFVESEDESEEPWNLVEDPALPIEGETDKPTINAMADLEDSEEPNLPISDPIESELESVDSEVDIPSNAQEFDEESDDLEAEDSAVAQEDTTDWQEDSEESWSFMDSTQPESDKEPQESSVPAELQDVMAESAFEDFDFEDESPNPEEANQPVWDDDPSEDDDFPVADTQDSVAVEAVFEDSEEDSEEEVFSDASQTDVETDEVDQSAEVVDAAKDENVQTLDSLLDSLDQATESSSTLSLLDDSSEEEVSADPYDTATLDEEPSFIDAPAESSSEDTDIDIFASDSADEPPLPSSLDSLSTESPTVIDEEPSFMNEEDHSYVHDKDIFEEDTLIDLQNEDTIFSEEEEEDVVLVSGVVSEEDSEQDPGETLVSKFDMETDSELEEELEEEGDSLFTSLDAFDDALEITEEVSQEENTEWLAELNASTEVFEEDSESIDYDDTEDVESRSVLNPIFQMNTRKATHSQISLIKILLAGLLVAISFMFVSQQFKEFASIEALSNQFDDKKPEVEVVAKKDLQETAIEKETGMKDTGNKDTATKPPAESKEKESVATLPPVADAKNAATEPKEKQEKKEKKDEKPQKQEPESNEPIVKVENPKNAVYLDDQPLSIRQKERLRKSRRSKKKKRKSATRPEETMLKIESTEDLAFYHREGWRRANIHSYAPAKRTFEEILKVQEADPISLFGLGYVEEKIAEGYFRDGKHTLAREQRESARKQYCKALSLIEYDQDSDSVFLRSQINSHLLGLKTDCDS
ncbi:MAG: hypothetical protein VX278_16730 [Myxococcota bacterium]|nr:hypothetical protein [Myxococcota bacterium]